MPSAPSPRQTSREDISNSHEHRQAGAKASPSPGYGLRPRRTSSISPGNSITIEPGIHGQGPSVAPMLSFIKTSQEGLEGGGKGVLRAQPPKSNEDIHNLTQRLGIPSPTLLLGKVRLKGEKPFPYREVPPTAVITTNIKTDSGYEGQGQPLARPVGCLPCHPFLAVSRVEPTSSSLTQVSTGGNRWKQAETGGQGVSYTYSPSWCEPCDGSSVQAATWPWGTWPSRGTRQERLPVGRQPPRSRGR